MIKELSFWYDNFVPKFLNVKDLSLYYTKRTTTNLVEELFSR